MTDGQTVRQTDRQTEGHRAIAHKPTAPAWCRAVKKLVPKRHISTTLMSPISVGARLGRYISEPENGQRNKYVHGTCTGWAKKRTVFRHDNFVTVSPRKAYSMSKFSHFYREKRYKTRISVSLNILCQICSNRHSS